MEKTIAQQLGVTKFPFKIKDDNGNETYWENSEGYWLKYTFDDNGNRTYWESSDGAWSKSTYDDNGNKTYREDSDGYTYGTKPAPLEGKEVEIEGVKYILTIKQ